MKHFTYRENPRGKAILGMQIIWIGRDASLKYGDPANKIPKKRLPVYAQSLAEKLFHIGGDRIALVAEDDGIVDPGDLSKAGKLVEVSRTTLRKGAPNECHHNSLRLWKTCPKYRFATGYALSDDGIWRRHSWLLNGTQTTIIETTEKRAAYFGFVYPPLADVREAIRKPGTEDVPGMPFAKLAEAMFKVDD